MNMKEQLAAPSPRHLEENWQALPQRLRGRAEWLLERGRIKDAELMFDAATEIECVRELKA